MSGSQSLLYAVNDRNGQVRPTVMVVFVISAALLAVSWVFRNRRPKKITDPVTLYSDRNWQSSFLGGGSNGSNGDVQSKDITYVKMGTFVVNINSQTQMRYLQAEVTLGVADLPDRYKRKQFQDEPELPPADDAIAKDTIVAFLSQQSFSELRSTENREKLKAQLRRQLLQRLKKTEPVSVLFTSFVMQ